MFQDCSRQQDTKASESDRREHTEVRASRGVDSSGCPGEGTGDATWALRLEGICPIGPGVAPWKEDLWRNGMARIHLQESVTPLRRTPSPGWQIPSMMRNVRQRPDGRVTPELKSQGALGRELRIRCRKVKVCG